MLPSNSTIMALDVGERRIGVAVASAMARLAQPLVTIDNDANVLETLAKLIEEQEAAMLVIGLPRNLNGDHTDQTRSVEAFGAMVDAVTDIPVHWQDEALTSLKAKQELESRGKKIVERGAIDSLAATYILEDFLTDHPEASA